MEMVKTYPKLSPFQQVLLRGLREGVLGEGDLERIKREGADLTLVTDERFFRASAREESYRYAVRLIETLLSFYLTTHPSNAIENLKQGSLSKMVREGVAELRKLNLLPTTSFLPRLKADTDILDLLVEKTRKLQLSTRDVLVTLEEEAGQRKRIDEAVTMAEFFIKRVGGKIQDFQSEACEDICHAQLLANIYKLEVGPYLTLTILKKVAKRKRPSLNDVESKLCAHQAVIPPELQMAYRHVMEGFLRLQSVREFFGQKASISVFTDQYGSMYYAERSAQVFDV